MLTFPKGYTENHLLLINVKLVYIFFRYKPNFLSNLKRIEKLFQELSSKRVRKSNRDLVRSSLVSREDLSLEEDVRLEDLGLNPLEIDVNNIYTPWTRWSRCKKKCKQVRKRFCTLSAICGSNVLKVPPASRLGPML
jgi:rRNA maturation endonuclease Nob1